MSTNKKTIVSDIDSYPCRGFDTFEREMRFNFERLRIKSTELVLVLWRNIDEAVFTPDNTLTVTTDRDRANNCAAGCVNRSNVMGAMIICEDTV